LALSLEYAIASAIMKYSSNVLSCLGLHRVIVATIDIVWYQLAQ